MVGLLIAGIVLLVFLGLYLAGITAADRTTWVGHPPPWELPQARVLRRRS